MNEVKLNLQNRSTAIQNIQPQSTFTLKHWIPAFAGMTIYNSSVYRHSSESWNPGIIKKLYGVASCCDCSVGSPNPTLQEVQQARISCPSLRVNVAKRQRGAISFTLRKGICNPLSIFRIR